MLGSKFTFYEFFAGGGMARAGLVENAWTCSFANDFDPKKCIAYAQNWRGKTITCLDVGKLKLVDLPGRANLVWASFPCQDLSLAGGGAGLNGSRSGTFWPFWSLMDSLISEGRAPDIIALENVTGTLTSHQGKDFEVICHAFTKSGYRFGAVVIDASLFVPQSRPRLFIIGVRNGVVVPRNLMGHNASVDWHSKALCAAYDKLPQASKERWVWWRFSIPTKRTQHFADLIEATPNDVVWHSEIETQRLISMMSVANLEKVARAKQSGRLMIGTIYRRTRANEEGQKVQRAEVRFDDVAGCLRTPAGGSSRQIILFVEGNTVKSRLISSRETARLMGLSDDYILPKSYNEAYHLTGDGVVVPVVRHLAEELFEPLLHSIEMLKAVA